MLAGAGIFGRELYLYSKLDLSTKKIVITKGEKKPLRVNSQRKTTWASKDKSIATISDTGEVTGLKKGSTVITAKCMDKTMTCKVTVEDPEISSIDMVLLPGESQTLKVEGTSQRIKWESENPNVEVKSGKVTANAPCDTYVSATIGPKKLTCHVYVPEPSMKEEYEVEREGKLKIALVNAPKGVSAGWSVADPDILEIAKQKNNVVKLVAKNTGITEVVATIDKQEYKTKVSVVGSQDINIEAERDEMNIGETQELTLTDCIPSYNITWENAEDLGGGKARFTASADGPTTVKATVDTGVEKHEVTKEISIKQKSLNMTEWTGKRGESFQLLVHDGEKVQYTFDRTYLSYTNKTFTALQEGTTTITVVDGDFSATCTVTILGNTSDSSSSVDY